MFAFHVLQFNKINFVEVYRYKNWW